MAPPFKERGAPKEEKRGRPTKEKAWGVGKVVRGTPRVEGGNPSPKIGAWGLVWVRGGCNHLVGRTNKGKREGRE